MASRKRINLTNSSSRSIRSFLSISHEKVVGGEVVQKKRMEADLDGEVENELKKITYYLYCIHSDCAFCFITVFCFIKGCPICASNKEPFSFP